MRGRALANSSRNPETAIAWLFVALLHAVVVWVVSRPVFMEPGNVGPPLQVVFIQRPHSKQQPVAKSARVVVAQGRKAASQVRSEPRLSRPPKSNPTMVVGDDVWDRPATTPADGITFTQNPFASTYNPRPRPAPGLFRMRRQLSPEDIVRGVSQILGFWPPGYTDDPCAGLDKAVSMLTAASTRREQYLLVDALRERDKYCN